jgi:hypothetical protein
MFQSAWRRRVAAKNYKQAKQSAVSIQVRFAASARACFFGCRFTYHFLRCCQAMFRGRSARKEYLSAKLSMVRLQAMVKAMLARRKYNSLRKGVMSCGVRENAATTVT